MVAACRKAELELLDSIRLDQRCALHMAGAIRTLRIVAPLLTLDAAPAVGPPAAEYSGESAQHSSPEFLSSPDMEASAQPGVKRCQRQLGAAAEHIAMCRKEPD